MNKRKRKRKKIYFSCLVCQSRLEVQTDPMFPKVEGTYAHVSIRKASLGDIWFRRYWCSNCKQYVWYRFVKTETKPYPRILVSDKDVDEAFKRILPHSEGNSTVSEYTRRHSQGINDYTRRYPRRT